MEKRPAASLPASLASLSAGSPALMFCPSGAVSHVRPPLPPSPQHPGRQRGGGLCAGHSQGVSTALGHSSAAGVCVPLTPDP